ncbi:hypothetical protein [Actinoplanes sp. NPDC026623]|uniref:hypothetical protein n=1 Tax=Actinoplanes sp. NPDC026623 TaxID=3155610 RepID=UPI0033D10E24
MTRTRIALTLTSLGLTGLLTLTACGAVTGTPGVSAGTVADVADEAYALQEVGLETGLETGLEAAPGASASASAAPGKVKGKDKRGKHAGARRFLGKNTLHGELTVQGKKGVRTVLVQRGTVTAVTATTVSVKSSDGFALTWTLGDKLRVVQDRTTVDAAAIKAGAQVWVAGAEDGDKNVARLVAIG